jgi:hypothetical protein
MGFGFVDIGKTGQSGDIVTYAYEHQELSGAFTINIASGEITDIGTPMTRAAYAAQYKIITHWRKGELPERTQWAG